jgi:hypothetical protein
MAAAGRTRPPARRRAARARGCGTRRGSRPPPTPRSRRPVAGRLRGRPPRREERGPPPRGQALRHLETAAARHQGRRPAVQHVVHAEEVAAADLQHIPEAIGGDQPGPGALALEEGVDADGCPVDDEPAVGQAGAGLVHAAEDALEEVLGGGERLGVDHRPGRLVESDQVSEGAADVDADSESHFPRSIGRAGRRRKRVRVAWVRARL